MEEGGGVTANRGHTNDTMHLHIKQNSLKGGKGSKNFPESPQQSLQFRLQVDFELYDVMNNKTQLHFTMTPPRDVRRRHYLYLYLFSNKTLYICIRITDWKSRTEGTKSSNYHLI